MQVIVHGGAGGPSEEPRERAAVLEEAATAGSAAAEPLDAVEAAVNVLESSPRFNAGVGGAVQSDGVVRTDAGVMRSDRSAGAACAMPGVEHAVSVARVVLEETPHVLIAGEHAVALGNACGVETGADLITDRTRERWEGYDAPAEAPPDEQLAWARERFGADLDGAVAAGTPGAETDEDPKTVPDDGGGLRDHDTVGAVARAGDRLAAATSTGGRWLALAGRVGDVPQVGSGFYCAPAGGASATGAGEDIARVTLSRRAVGHLERGRGAAEAAELAIDEFAELTGASAGIIVIDREGGVGSAYNSEEMGTAVARG